MKRSISEQRFKDFTRCAAMAEAVRDYVIHMAKYRDNVDIDAILKFLNGPEIDRANQPFTEEKTR